MVDVRTGQGRRRTGTRRAGTRRAVGALLLVACAQVLVAEAVVASAWDAGAPYSRVDDHVSDLGMTGCGELGGRAVCSPRHAWMNASFLLQGVLVAAAAVLLRGAVPRRWRGAVVTAAVVHAAGVALVGLVPRSLTPGGPSHLAHDAGAVLAVLGGNATIVLAALALRRAERAWAVVSLVLAAVGLAAVLLDVSGADPGLGGGAVQRATMYGVPLWLVLTGAALLASGSARGRPRPGGMGA